MDIAIYTLGCKVNQYETQAMEQEALDRQKLKKWITGLTMSTSLFRKALRISHYPISAFRYYTGQECARENFLHLLLPISTLSQNRLISTKLSSDFMEKIYLLHQRLERASERFPFQIFSARNFRNIWTQDICFPERNASACFFV